MSGKMSFFQDIGSSRWFETLAASTELGEDSRKSCVLKTSIDPTPNGLTKRPRWFMSKSSWIAILCSLGVGRLPDWLRNKRGVVSLDTYRDNRCLFRCIAVHWGAHVRDNMRKTRELEEAFFTQRPGLRNRLTDKHLPLLEQHFKQGIAAYTVQPNGGLHLDPSPGQL